MLLEKPKRLEESLENRKFKGQKEGVGRWGEQFFDGEAQKGRGGLD